MLEAANSAPSAACASTGCAAGWRAAVGALAAEGIKTGASAGCPRRCCRGTAARTSRVSRRPGHAQSRGSQLAGLIARGRRRGPGARVLDRLRRARRQDVAARRRCRRGAVVAVEVDEARCGRPARQPRPAGRGRRRGGRADALELPALGRHFDAVLLDAPCTGLGTLASRADLRWRRHPRTSRAWPSCSAQPAARAPPPCQPGGALTYSVCTLRAPRRSAVVDALLAGGGWSARRPRRGLAAVWRHPGPAASCSAALARPARPASSSPACVAGEDAQDHRRGATCQRTTAAGGA